MTIQESNDTVASLATVQKKDHVLHSLTGEESDVSTTLLEDTEAFGEEQSDTRNNTRQWLAHCIEVETKPEYCRQRLEIHLDAIDSIVADSNNSIHNKTGKEVTVHITTVPQGEFFDFDTVHHLPLPRVVEEYKVVYEMVYQDNEDSGKYFLRIKVDLNAFDGVTALHGGFNLIEYLETKNAATLSPYPFNTSNPPLPDHQFENFQNQMQRIEEAKQKHEPDKENIEGLKWSRTPSMAVDFEEVFKERPGLRFTKVDLSFREILKRIDQAKQVLDIPFYAATINYAPNVAVSLCPTLEDFMDRERKVSNICLPPVGVGPPAPMNEQHVEDLFNTLFLNSYGKHAAPRTTHAKVVGYVWDWMGLLKSFAPMFHVSQIQDKLFLSVTACPPDMEKLRKSKLFFDDETVGQAQPFVGRPFYQPKEQADHRLFLNCTKTRVDE
eukprot:scaffold3742_cov118-Cylindrotheca_fusiformis.AAC.3